MTKVFKAGHRINVVGQNGIISGETHGRNPKNSFPIFGDWLIPHMILGSRADARAKVRGIRFDAKVDPFRNVLPEPIFGSSMKLLKVRKIGRNNNLFGNIQFKVGEEFRFVENRFDSFEELEAAKGSSNVIGASSNDAVRGFLIGRLKLGLEGI